MTPTTTALDLFKETASTTANAVNAGWPLFFGFAAALLSFWAAYVIFRMFTGAVRRM